MECDHLCDQPLFIVTILLIVIIMAMVITPSGINKFELRMPPFLEPPIPRTFWFLPRTLSYRGFTVHWIFEMKSIFIPSFWTLVIVWAMDLIGRVSVWHQDRPYPQRQWVCSHYNWPIVERVVAFCAYILRLIRRSYNVKVWDCDEEFVASLSYADKSS